MTRSADPERVRTEVDRTTHHSVDLQSKTTTAAGASEPAGPRFAALPSILLAGYVVGVTCVYIVAAAAALRRPLNQGADTFWAALIFIVFAAISLSHITRRRPSTTLTWMCLFVATAVVLSVTSGQWAAVLSTFAILIAAGTSGFSFLRLLSIRGVDSRQELVVFSLTLGLGILSILTLAFGLAGGLTPQALSLGMAGLLGAQWRTLRELGTASRKLWSARSLDRVDVLDGSLFTSVVFLSLLTFVWALAPEIQYDALNYQLAVPKAYLDADRIVDLPYFWHSYFAHLLNMNFTLAMAFGGQTGAKLLAWSVAVITVVAVYRLGYRVGSRRTGLLAAAMFASTPLSFWLATTAYVDIGVALFLMAAVLAAFNWSRTLQPSWLYTAAASAGCAVGTKSIAAFGLPVLACFFISRLISARALRLRTVMSALLLFLMFSAPWYLLVYLQTGNPTFPLLNEVFKSPYWPAGVSVGNFHLFGVGTSPEGLLALPVSWILRSDRFAEAVTPGALGAGFALIPATLTFVLLRRSWPSLLVLICGAYLGLWILTVQYARYFMPVFPLVTVLIAALPRAANPLYASRSLTSCIVIISLFQSLLCPVMFWNARDRIPVRVALGVQPRDDFLVRSLPGYRAVTYLNEHAGPNARVFGIATEHLRYYLNRPMATPTQTLSLQHVVERFDGESRLVEFKKQGYEYVLMKDANDVPWQSAFRQTFLQRYSTIEFSDGAFSVHRLGLAPTEQGPNLLFNPGFEKSENGAPAGWFKYGNPTLIRDGRTNTGAAAVLSRKNDGYIQIVEVAPGRLYSLEHFSRADGAGQSARLQINWLNIQGAIVHVSIEVVPTSLQWRRQRMIVTAPPGAARAAIYASVHEDSEIFFDDFWFGTGARNEH